MSSSRKYSVHRHITVVHGGAGEVVLFQDYLAGRSSSLPLKAQALAPLQQKRNLQDPESIYHEEFFRELARLDAQLFYKKFQRNSKSEGDVLDILESLRDMKFFENRKIYPGHLKPKG